jgi:hypothetical protein
MSFTVKKISIINIFIIILVLISSYQTFANDTAKPVINKNFTFQYNPLINKIFKDPTRLYVYYTFDYWDNPLTKKTNDSTLLLRLQNSSRKKIVEMTKKDSIWESSILVPSNAKILSYIITDGLFFDINDQKTFSDYIYNEKSQPVRESSVYMSQIIRLTNKDLNIALEEIKKEILNYPANFTAYYFYWQLYLYKNLFSNESKNYVTGEIKKLLNDYSANPEVCNLAVKVHNGGLIKTDELFEIVEKIPFNYLSDENKKYIKLERETKNFQKRLDSLLNSKAPEIELEDFKSNKISLSTFNNKVVLLLFWTLLDKTNTWNIPPLDSLQKIQAQYKDLQILIIYTPMIYYQKGKYTIDDFLNEHKYDFTFLKGNEKISDLYCARGITFRLIDKKGIIRFMDESDYRNRYKNLRTRIEKALLEK